MKKWLLLGAREEDAWGAAVAAVEAKRPEGGPGARSGAQGDEADDAAESRSEPGTDEPDDDTVMAYFGDHQVHQNSLPCSNSQPLCMLFLQ